MQLIGECDKLYMSILNLFCSLIHRHVCLCILIVCVYVICDVLLFVNKISSFRISQVRHLNFPKIRVVIQSFRSHPLSIPISTAEKKKLYFLLGIVQSCQDHHSWLLKWCGVALNYTVNVETKVNWHGMMGLFGYSVEPKSIFLLQHIIISWMWELTIEPFKLTSWMAKT